MSDTPAPPPLRPHQSKALARAVEELTPRSPELPATGLRTQIIMATGSGKTLVAVRTADHVGGDRVLVLVPSLDLLDQTARAWRDGGRAGAFVGVSSLDPHETGFPNTTDPHALVQLTSAERHERVTVFATYASLGNGILEVAHGAGLAPWGLIVVDEAHRTSGRAGKPWAVVHDNARIPAAARLYMTATPRIWAAGDAEEEDGELVASMTDAPDGLFGRVAYRLPLETAIEEGIVAPYQVVVVDVQDHQLNAAMLAGDEKSDTVRGLRLGALQAATLKAAEQEGLRRMLSFHQRVSEAEAFAVGLPDKARTLPRQDGGPVPSGDGAVWAQWLHGEHKPAHRRRVLGQFAAGLTDSGQDAQLSLIASVKVLGEGVDTRACDAVVFCDVRGSMPDLVQAVGRALRMHPGEGKIATLVVPAFLGTGETPETMLTSPAYAGLAKLLTALRAHDTRIEQLTSPATPALARPGDRGFAPVDQDDEQAPESVPARSLLRFSRPRDAHQLASFVQLRVLNPERVQWRRGIQAAQRYLAEHDDLRVPYGFRTPEDWAPAGFPLGVWIADCRRHYKAGALDGDRIVQLEKLGMLWSLFDARFDEGLTAAAAWAAESGVGLAAPVGAEHGGYPVGRWLKNQRAAARRAKAPLSPDRRTALAEIDPGWCPEWTIDWQRAVRLAQRHVAGGGALPKGPGFLVEDGEDLGRWIAAQRQGFAKLTGEQQAMLAALGMTQASAPVKRTREEMWAHSLKAAAQFRARVGNLDVPRSHSEQVDGEAVRLGAWISQQRVKADKLSAQRVEELSALDMRWS
ncbi:DEAD/DEAH box helicase [Streptomyces antarcticus]|uniref:DEAD/DEAH box helicase n=1 Tax=Streptomyces antarcticus TaxID=2996458 RepID=UPI0022714B22|nr:DEAD/DEAH box helicase [Streptomyces sp. H34-AA3]MCY0946319.1 Helicase associated domain protein [Streptomyces sp. H34-AA3]